MDDFVVIIFYFLGLILFMCSAKDDKDSFLKFGLALFVLSLLMQLQKIANLLAS